MQRGRPSRKTEQFCFKSTPEMIEQLYWLADEDYRTPSEWIQLQIRTAARAAGWKKEGEDE